MKDTLFECHILVFRAASEIQDINLKDPDLSIKGIAHVKKMQSFLEIFMQGILDVTETRQNIKSSDYVTVKKNLDETKVTDKKVSDDAYDKSRLTQILELKPNVVIYPVISYLKRSQQTAILILSSMFRTEENDLWTKLLPKNFKY